MPNRPPSNKSPMHPPSGLLQRKMSQTAKCHQQIVSPTVGYRRRRSPNHHLPIVRAISSMPLPIHMKTVWGWERNLAARQLWCQILDWYPVWWWFGLSVPNKSNAVLFRTTKYLSLPQSTTLLLRTAKYYSSTIPYHKVLLQHYLAQKSTTPVLLQYYSALVCTTRYYCTTKCYSSASLYWQQCS